MCEYCGKTPHSNGCPNAPETLPTTRCKICKEPLYEGDLVYMTTTDTYCPNCIKERFL